MTDFIFIASLFFYLLSVVGCLLLFLFSNNISFSFTRSLVISHFIGGFGFLFFAVFSDHTPTWISIFFWCSGILLAGDVFRKSFSKWLKVYFLAFLISIPLFIVIPSRIILLVAGKEFGKPGEGRFRVIDNYYLVRTSEPMDSMGLYRSKFIKEMGFFHRTIARGIPTRPAIDSIRLSGPIQNDSIGSIILFSGSEIDTVEVFRYKTLPKKNQITIKPQ